jgi:hypothetical protein
MLNGVMVSVIMQTVIKPKYFTDIKCYFYKNFFLKRNKLECFALASFINSI